MVRSPDPARAPHALRRQPGPRRRRLLPLAYAAQRSAAIGSPWRLSPNRAVNRTTSAAPRQILDIQDAALVVHLSHFQPAVDATVAARGRRSSTSPRPDLLTLTEEQSQEPTNRGGGPRGSHWLDRRVWYASGGPAAQPTRQRRGCYRANAAAFTAQLATLDAEVEQAWPPAPIETGPGHGASAISPSVAASPGSRSAASPDLEPGARPGLRREFVREHDVRPSMPRRSPARSSPRRSPGRPGPGHQSSVEGISDGRGRRLSRRDARQPCHPRPWTGCREYPLIAARRQLRLRRSGRRRPSRPVGGRRRGRRPARPQRLGKVDPSSRDSASSPAGYQDVEESRKGRGRVEPCAHRLCAWLPSPSRSARPW